VPQEKSSIRARNYKIPSLCFSRLRLPTEREAHIVVFCKIAKYSVFSSGETTLPLSATGRGWVSQRDRKLILQCLKTCSFAISISTFFLAYLGQGSWAVIRSMYGRGLYEDNNPFQRRGRFYGGVLKPIERVEARRTRAKNPTRRNLNSTKKQMPPGEHIVARGMAVLYQASRRSSNRIEPAPLFSTPETINASRFKENI
jgi:hypothetical protein